MPRKQPHSEPVETEAVLRFPRNSRERKAVKDRHWITLRHATPTRNLPSILASGLLVSYSCGKMAAVWLHSADQTAWAACHAAKRHHADVFEVTILEVSVPRASVVKHGRGKWYVRQDVHASAIKAAAEFAVFSDLWGATKA